MSARPPPPSGRLARAVVVVIVIIVIVASSCANCGPVTCNNVDARTITVGSEECAKPCVVDFGDVSVPLNEQRRVAIDGEGCDLFGQFLFEGDIDEDFDGVPDGRDEDGDGELDPRAFDIASQTSFGPTVFAQVQFTPLEEGEARDVLQFRDDNFGDTIDIAVVGNGVPP